MAQQAAVTEYSKLEGAHKDHWVQLLIKCPFMGGTIPKISKCMLSTDEKMHISSHKVKATCSAKKPNPSPSNNK